MKKPDKWKKYSVSIMLLASSFKNIWSCLISVLSKLPQQKKGNLRNISQPRPMASASKNFSHGSFFSTLVTWKTLQIDKNKFVLRLGGTIIDKKYYFYFNTWVWIRCQKKSCLCRSKMVGLSQTQEWCRNWNMSKHKQTKIL